jgi:hypothetical protein
MLEESLQRKKDDGSGRPIQMYINGQCFHDGEKLDRQKNTKNFVSVIIFCFLSTFSTFLWPQPRAQLGSP